MFFFYIILTLIIIISILIILTTIKFQIQNMQISTQKEIKTKYQIIIIFSILNKIDYLNLKITPQKIKKELAKKNIKKFEEKIKQNQIKSEKIALEIMKNLKFKINSLNLKIKISLENSSINAIATGVISTVISILLGKMLDKKIIKSINQIKWEIMPLYKNENFLNITLDCIISLNLIHIIYTIYKIKKKGEKNVRASNRRAYANCNE